MYQSHVYSGKPAGQPNEFYISGTDNYVKYLVSRLLENHPLRVRNISMDCLYSSIPIAQWLLEHNSEVTKSHPKGDDDAQFSIH